MSATPIRKTPARIMVGFLSGDTVCSDFAQSLFRLAVIGAYSHMDKYLICGLINTKTSIVHKGRNDLVKEAMGVNGITHILFLDSDMTFPPDTIARLLVRNEKIIGCDYSTRRAPFKGTKHGNCLGFGCILIDVKVFQTIQYPWFEIPYLGDDVMGEDFNFCHKAAAAGIEVVCHDELSKEIGHLGMTEHKL